MVFPVPFGISNGPRELKETGKLTNTVTSQMICFIDSQH